MILIYLLKVSVCLLVFFATYKLLLSRLTFFRLNRIYLLSTLLISFVIPALTIEHKQEVVVVNQPVLNSAISYSNDRSVEHEVIDGSSNPYSINWLKLAAFAYLFIAGALAIRNLFMMGLIKRSLRKFMISKTDSVILVSADSKIKNCSFFNKIIIDSSLPKPEQELVLRHESVHVNQRHVIDKLVVNLAACILWFNPVIYFWRSEIDNNHEFLADEATIEIVDKGSYASLLLNLAMPSNGLVVNGFSKLPLKNRITMLYKKPDSGFQKITYLIVIPVISICCFAFVNKKEVLIRKIEIVNSKIGNQSKVTEKRVVIGLKNTTDLVSNLVKADTISSNKQSLLSSNVINSALDLDEIPKYTTINAEIRDLATNRELVLVVDAGHGGQDGATKSPSGIAEKDLNLRAVQILKEEADKRGIKVVLTRDRDKMIPLRNRLPGENATAFISIHYNSMPKPNMKVPFEGVEVIVSKQNPNIKYAEQFGFNILKSLNSLNGMTVRDSLKNANLFLLRESKVPAIVIELGNINSEKSLAYFSDEKNLRIVSNLILDGFTAYTKS
ncbi:M56/M15 family metallopeptidase [Pedobacter sp. Leaf176]|uniref:M56/M15 family metallopeptidase n=1 Tax=Pedobacter sp. Leaf176 TaxID=1736286 RepID=UPI0006F2B5BC|nr:M56/M15 family metallopeptidase [Pedobacter sp. Leaf176]KQR69813.1 hypothetical protein ASF92_13990 [Pedobacter sp. Leaf176]